jgi:hypothetical protein
LSMAPSILATVDAALVMVSLDECRCMAKAALAAQSAAAARERVGLLAPALRSGLLTTSGIQNGRGGIGAAWVWLDTDGPRHRRARRRTASLACRHPDPRVPSPADASTAEEST